MDDPAFAVPEEPDGLSIGAINGGGNWKVADAVMAVARRVAEARARHPADLSLNVVFHIPGSFLQPDFDGVRLGTVFTTKRAILSQVAVPATLDADDVAVFAFDAVHAAIDLAAERISKRRLGWDVEALRATASDAQTSA